MEIKKAIEVLSNAKYADEFQGDEELTEATIMARNALEYRLPKRPIETKEIAGHRRLFFHQHFVIAAVRQLITPS